MCLWEKLADFGYERACYVSAAGRGSIYTSLGNREAARFLTPRIIFYGRSVQRTQTELQVEARGEIPTFQAGLQ